MLAQAQFQNVIYYNVLNFKLSYVPLCYEIIYLRISLFIPYTPLFFSVFNNKNCSRKQKSFFFPSTTKWLFYSTWFESLRLSCTVPSLILNSFYICFCMIVFVKRRLGENRMLWVNWIRFFFIFTCGFYFYMEGF